MNKCLNCNKETKNPKFCSLSCSATYQAQNRLPYPYEVANCLQCLKQINLDVTGKSGQRRKFCNHSCAASYNNKLKAKQRNCINCHNQLKYSQKKYCSRECQTLFQNSLTIDKWLNDEISGLTTTGTLMPVLKKYLIELRGNKCELCNWAERNVVTDKVPIVADHIDGNWENNRPENIKLLCPNCDSLQPTYKALNKGNGRTWRRQVHPGAL